MQQTIGQAGAAGCHGVAGREALSRGLWLVAGEARFVQRLIARFAIREVGGSPAAGRGVLF